MSVRIIVGDVRDKLRDLPDESVNCVVTSPPYFGLRDYGTAKWEGGDEACDHKGPPRQSQRSTLRGNGHGEGKPLSHYLQSLNQPFRHVCGKCGARRIDSQIGLEQTPADYVAEMVGVFREVWRVLRRDGTCWVNLGDSYNAAGRVGHGTRVGRKQGTNRASANGADACRPSCASLKPKDLLGIPWRVAFALQDDGWWLRRDIIWHKSNPMPESALDRCTTAHEYLFMLTKAERYYYDAEAIKEPVTGNAHRRGNGVNAKIKVLGGWDGGKEAHGAFHREGGGARAYRPKQNPSFSAAVTETVEMRNKRSVWTIPTAPYPEAHFATFPPALVEPCIKAGCPAGGTVLDPFFGSGTTGLVADRLGRDCIGIELNPTYADMARSRLSQDAGMFTRIAAE
jgi:DNA modification methylase